MVILLIYPFGDEKMNLIVFLFATIGMSHILVDGTIFHPAKVWLGKCGKVGQFFLSLFNCYQCTGFWSGGIIGTLMWVMGKDPLAIESNFGIAFFVYACAGAFVSMMMAVITIWIQVHSEIGE